MVTSADIKGVVRTGTSVNELAQINRDLSTIKELIAGFEATIDSETLSVTVNYAPEWGLIEGSLSAQTDLKVALDSRPTKTAAENISGIWDFTNGLQSNGNPVVGETDGVWTPVIYGTTTAGSHTYTAQTGQWKRHRDLMFVDCLVQLSSKDAAMAGDVRIGGLPVSANVARSGVTFATLILGAGTLPAGFQQMVGWINSTNVWMRYMNTGGGISELDSSHIGNSCLIRFSAVYPVA